MKPYQPQPPLTPQPISIYDSSFMRAVDRLYEPVMGVENLSYMIHALVRFTKPLLCVEIGSGYTTLFILAALRENEIEMRRVNENKKHIRLLDYPWVVEAECLDDRSSKLICVDNLKHQKEMATSAWAIAGELGLEDLLDFEIGDAFDNRSNVRKNSVDLLFADFGVGRRAQEFMRANWETIRPGGYVIIHSTLTNANTRSWVEALRKGAPAEETGIDQGEFEFVSFFERHKRFQNSFTLLQKREGYSEPLFSESA